MPNPESETTYSISLRLQRTTVEYAYVKVLVTDDLIKPDGHIDVPKMSERAIEIGRLPEVAWYQEEQRIELHPIQKLPDTDERATRGF